MKNSLIITELKAIDDCLLDESLFFTRQSINFLNKLVQQCTHIYVTIYLCNKERTNNSQISSISLGNLELQTYWIVCDDDADLWSSRSGEHGVRDSLFRAPVAADWVLGGAGAAS